ncbi:MAG: bifunctional DNA primase/helicase, partial [Phormidium sp. SL48-SHIP]
MTSTAKLVGIKSAKGTGKTEAIADYIQEYINQGQPVILLSHRVQLVKALTERFGIDNAYNFRISDTKGVLGLGLCVDSLHSESQVNFSPDNWDDFILVIDEVEQVIPHTLISSKTTVASHRTEVLANLSTLCQNASQIILSDADLSDRAFNYIRSLTGNCSQHIIQNDYQPARGTKLYNYKTPETWLDALVEKLGDGEKILIPTDSQQAKSTWGAQTLESLIKEVYSNLRVIRIDSETIVNPEHEAYQAIEHLDSLISQYDVVIYTPVLGTGVSIDLKGHFDSVFSINQGTQSENSTRQFIARLREGIPRHCYFKAIGCNFLGGGETSDYEVHRSQKAQVKQNLSNLGKLEKSPLDFDGNHCKAYAQYIANHNLSLSAYRENVLEGLRQEGYEITTIEDIDDETRKDFRDMMKETRNGNYDNLTSAIAQTETPSDTELTALESKQELTDSQRHQLRKGKMEKLYGVEADQELVEQDDDGLYANLSLLFWLTIGR